MFKVYSDAGYSGATLERPALQELLEDLKKEKIDIVFVYKIDRLTRSPKDFYQLIEFFEQAKIDFISITERFDTSTPAGRLLRNIMLTFSQFERELTSERTKDKMLERAKKGMCNGGNTPYGYARENKKLIPYPKEAEEIKSIFENYLETGSLSKVYRMAIEKGIKNKRGKNFSKTTIFSILRNVVYVGKIKYNDEIYQGTHEPIISEEIFALAQKIHKNKRKNFRVYKNFLFGGLIKCDRCGSKMTSYFTNKRTDGKLTRYYYYRCTSTLGHDWQACSVKQVSAERLENFCIENLEWISVDSSYIENLVFRLNHDLQITSPTSQNEALRTPHEAEYELTPACSKFSQFSSEKIAHTLKLFLSALKTKTGVERNLFAKRFLEKITYSPESIKISFVLGENLFNSLQMQSPACEVQGGALNLSKNFSALMQKTNNEFVSLCNAPQKKFQRTFMLVLPNLIHKARTCLPKFRRRQKKNLS